MSRRRFRNSPTFVTDARSDGYAILNRETLLYFGEPVEVIEQDIKSTQLQSADKRVVMRILGGDESHFLKSLVEEVWSLPLETFRYQLQWAKL